ncbi:MAG: glycosyltransferase [Acaryochloris sp. RU_4_1]|nr:glycosyltransferase [Acaryochloris sp. SU_5_25]NJM65637.1 glycosyltransferase [Acaryochloris sp. RU_4_1]
MMAYLPWLILPFCCTAVLYYGYAIYAAVYFFQQEQWIDPGFHPPVTILKPLCGIEINTYNNLASFCCQDYPQYQVIFSIRTATDPSVPIVRELMQAFPEVDISLVICDRTIGTNLKVSNLANAIEKAKHGILVLADCDILVRPHYLQQIVQPLSHPQVGVVTCLYNSWAKGWLAKFEALGIATYNHANVLAAHRLEGMHFAFGSTIVIRRLVLDQIGGFATLADYLADDFHLGHLPTQLGYQVVLSAHVVEHQLTTTSLSEFFHRQARWARCIRVERFWGYVGLLFTYGTISGLLFLWATQGSWLGWSVLAVTLITRWLMTAIIAIHYLQDQVAKTLWWLVPIRDLVNFGIWCYGLVGTTVEWRGYQYKLSKDGKLAPMVSAKCSL